MSMDLHGWYACKRSANTFYRVASKHRIEIDWCPSDNGLSSISGKPVHWYSFDDDYTFNEQCEMWVQYMIGLDRDQEIIDQLKHDAALLKSEAEKHGLTIRTYWS